MWGVFFVLLAGLIPACIYLTLRYEFKTKTQLVCLAIAISVFLQFMLSALLVIILGCSPWLYLSIIVVVNLYSMLNWKRSQIRFVQLKNQSNRWTSLPLYTTIGTVLFYRFITLIPFGMDWIGFAIIASEYGLANQGLIFSEFNWWYSPALPALVTHVEFFTAQGYLNTTFDVGIAGFIALLCGLYGAFEQREVSFQMMVSMIVGIAIFAKFFDSGYPTVSSLIPISLAIFLYFSKQDTTLTRSVLLVGNLLIHPTGFLYLFIFYFAILLQSLRDESPNHAPQMNSRFVFIMVLLFLGFESVVRVFNVSTDHWIEQEYGWQGGVPFLMFNVLLLLPALYCYLQCSKTRDIRLFSHWFLLLYLLSIIQYIGPFTPILLFGFLSQILYSMSLHAFHIPLAGIVALSFRTNNITFQQESLKWLKSLILVALLIFPLVLVLQVTPLEQNKAIQSSDLELMERYSTHYDSLFSENAPWGYVWTDHESEFLGKPTVGLAKFDSTTHTIALTAIRFNDVDTISNLGIDAVLTSPMGMLQWYLSTSEYWIEVDNIDGSRLWEFNVEGTAMKWDIVHVSSENCFGCESRHDIWYEQHSIGHRLGFDGQTQFIEEGQFAEIHLQNIAQQPQSMCLTYITHGSTGGIFILVNNESHRLDSSAGYHRICIHKLDVQKFVIHWQHTSSSMYINPTGISGRGEHIVDSTGISLVAIETN